MDTSGSSKTIECACGVEGDLVIGFHEVSPVAGVETLERRGVPRSFCVAPSTPTAPCCRALRHISSLIFASRTRRQDGVQRARSRLRPGRASRSTR